MRGTASLEAMITLAAIISLILAITAGTSWMTKTYNLDLKKSMVELDLERKIAKEYEALGQNKTYSGWYIEYNGSWR